MESFEKKDAFELQTKFWNQIKFRYLIKFTNFFFALGIINLILDSYQGVLEFKNENIFLILIDLGLVVVIGLSNLLLRNKKINLGLGIFFLFSTILSVSVSLVGGIGTGHHLYLLIITFSVIFFIFNTDRRKTFLVGLLFFIIIIFNDYNDFSLLMKEKELNEKTIQLFFTESILISIFCLMLSMEVLLRVYSKLVKLFDDSNLNLLKIMESADSSVFLFNRDFEIQFKTKKESMDNIIFDSELNLIKLKLSELDKGEIFKNEFLAQNNKWYRTYLKNLKFEKNNDLLLYLKEDISELKRKLEIIANKKNFLNDSTTNQILFLSNFSHEIRTPLNSISGLAEILQDKIHDENKLKFIELKKNAIYLADFINEILFLSKIESGKYSLTENSFEVKNFILLLKNKLDEFQLNNLLEFEDGKIEVRILHEDDTNIIVFLKNFLEILLEEINSKVNIMINTFQNKTNSILEIELKFLHKENLKILNEVFFIADSNLQNTEISINSIKFEILRNLLNYFNVRFNFIDINNEKKIKLIFTFESKELNLKNKLIRSDTKIIVIDDYLVNRIVIEEILIKLGLNYKIFSSALDFLKVIDQEKFDCILIDILMPDIDGYEAAKLINKNLGEKKIPIIAITALNEPDIEITLKDAGIIDLIQKPFELNEIKAKLEKYLGVEFEN